MLEIKKKNTQFSITEVDTFFINNIKKSVINFTDEWDLDITRQKIYKTHKQTKVYSLRQSSYLWKNGDPLEYLDTNTFSDKLANQELLNIYSQIEQKYSGTVIRSELIALLPYSIIPKHVDSGDSLYIGRRLHIPIITNDNVYFTVMNNKINMLEGTGYEINNGMPHSVENNSDSTRVHLIIDVISI